MKTKTTTLEKVLTGEMACFALFFSVALFAPVIGLQAVTGPLVNAILFLAVILIGLREAVLIALLPSVVAVSVGLLPAVMIPMVPLIIIGNVILVVVFNYFHKDFWKGVLLAAYFKFLFLFASSIVVTNFFTTGVVAQQASVMMSWPQLATALAGGLIAYALLSLSKKI